jgi:glycosyltransferase involved in cell wall biosynthesis
MMASEATLEASQEEMVDRPVAEVLRGKRVAVVVFSHYPSDPRPRRAAEALAQAGMNVDVISLRQDPREPSRDTFNGVSVLRIPLQHWRGSKVSYVLQYAFFILAALFVLMGRSLTRRYHLVHVHNMPDILVFSGMIPKLLGAKVILDLHDPMPELMMTIYDLEEDSFAVRMLKRLEKLSIRFADAVLTVSSTFRDLFTARSCPREKLQVIMNSPDETIFQYRELSWLIPDKRDGTKAFVIMYHGSLVERHGLDLAVEALAALRSSIPNAELRIYGRSTPFIEQVMQSVERRGLQSSVHYLGEKRLEQIVEAIDECDIGIIPNRRSVFTELNTPTRIFEYLARGKPVIAPRTKGIQDYFGEDALIFFELGDEQDLARQLQRAYNHPGQLQEVVRRGQAIYREYRWSTQRSQLVAFTSTLFKEAPHQTRA